MNPAGQLERRLSAWDATSLVIGAVVGSAIFLVPSTLARIHPSPVAAMLVFLFAGAISFFGALAYAELGAMFPETGGEYVFLREAWGPAAAFLCGWTHLIVIQSGGIAAIATGFAALAGGLVNLSEAAKPVVAVGAIVLFTAANYCGVKLGAVAGNVLTVSKVAGLGVMILAVSSRPHTEDAPWTWPQDWTLAQFAQALVPALWAFEGWNLVTFVAGEMKQPKRGLPVALALGLGAVIVVYCASLWVIFQALPVTEIAASDRVAADAAQRVLGPAGGKMVTVTMLVALAGALNACILTAPRLYYAQSRDGLQLRFLGRLDPRFGTPGPALILQMVWCSVLALTGSYETLFSYCTFGAWIFYATVVAGLMKLRRTRPAAERPYRLPGYPWTAALFIAAATGFVISTLVQTPGPSSAGIGLVLLGLVPYYFVRRRNLRSVG